MKVNTIENKQSFHGNLISNKLTLAQRKLFDMNKPNIEKALKDLPLNVTVESANSNSFLITSDGYYSKGLSYLVQNKDFVKTVNHLISETMKKKDANEKMLVANEILNYVKLHIYNVMTGKFKEASEIHKKIAKLGVENFDIYKSMTNFKITNVPLGTGFSLFKNSLKYRFYRFFVRKSPEEKKLYKMNKVYIKDLKAKKINTKPPLEINMSGVF